MNSEMPKVALIIALQLQMMQAKSTVHAALIALIHANSMKPIDSKPC